MSVRVALQSTYYDAHLVPGGEKCDATNEDRDALTASA
jgi:hypothetical protein